MIVGIVKGATKEVLSLASWVGSAFLTVMLFPSVMAITRKHIHGLMIADVVTACSLFIIFLTILSVLSYVCSNFIKRSVLSSVDKFLGAVFGIARGIVILVIINLVANQWLVVETVPDWVSKSKLRPYVVDVGNLIILVLPKTWQDSIVSHMNSVNRQSILNFIIDDTTGVGEEIAHAEAMLQDGAKASPQPENNFERQENTGVDSDEDAKELATLRPRVNSDSFESKTGKIPVANKTEKEKLDMKRFLDQREVLEEVSGEVLKADETESTSSGSNESMSSKSNESAEAEQQQASQKENERVSSPPPLDGALDSSELNIQSSAAADDGKNKKEK
jgi:membrane protein required for colicin V production